MRIVADGARRARMEVRDGAPAAELAGTIRHMLRMDDDLSPFYARGAEDPELAWAAEGAGRMLRSPTVFEDVVKTICTTNCTWTAPLGVGRPVHARVRSAWTQRPRPAR